jgi:molecular chaperone DnaJ
MRDFYEVLGVSRESADPEIKKAYRALAMKYHPDRNPDDPEAEDKFKEASNAYKVLSDPGQRARYDQFGHEGLGGGGPGGYGGFQGVEDIFSAFGDLFGDFFGGRGGQRRQARGEDLHADLELTFVEAVHGVTKEMEVGRRVACDTCEGSGAKPGTEPKRCDTCDGKGQVVHSQGFFMIQTGCPECRGAGQLIESPCPDCKGRRLRVDTSTLSVTVPAGVEDGQTLRLAGKGEASPQPGARPGHLYVSLHVGSDDRFLRRGSDVLTEVPISFITACLGGEVEVPILDDDCEGTTAIEIKAGTQPDEAIVRRGKGIQSVNGRGRGDHVVQFKVQIPSKLSSRAEELLRELAEESGVGVSEKKASLFSRIKRELKKDD